MRNLAKRGRMGKTPFFRAFCRYIGAVSASSFMPRGKTVSHRPTTACRTAYRAPPAAVYIASPRREPARRYNALGAAHLLANEQPRFCVYACTNIKTMKNEATKPKRMARSKTLTGCFILRRCATPSFQKLFSRHKRRPAGLPKATHPVFFRPNDASGRLKGTANRSGAVCGLLFSAAAGPRAARDEKRAGEFRAKPSVSPRRAFHRF